MRFTRADPKFRGLPRVATAAKTRSFMRPAARHTRRQADLDPQRPLHIYMSAMQPIYEYILVYMSTGVKRAADL